MVNTDDEIVPSIESIFKPAFPDWRGNNVHAIVDQVEFFCEEIKMVRSKDLWRNRKLCMCIGIRGGHA